MGGGRPRAIGGGAAALCALGATLPLGACGSEVDAVGERKHDERNGGEPNRGERGKWDRGGRRDRGERGAKLALAGDRSVERRGVRIPGSATTRLLSLPPIGTFSSRCHPSRAGEVEPTVVLTARSATITGHVKIAGAPPTRFRADPGEQVVTAPTQAVRQVWRVRYHHPPTPQTAVLRVRFARDRASGDCVLAAARLRLRRR